MDFKARYERSVYLDFFRNQLLPDDFEERNEPISLEFKPAYVQKVITIGFVPSLSLPVYEMIHTSENDPRVSISRDSFRILSPYGHKHALVIFTSPHSENFRLSLVTLDYQWGEDGKPKKEYSNPRRYSFFLGPEAKVHTVEKFLVKDGRITDFDDLQKRFSVEVVNKEFYNAIATLFTQLTGGKRLNGKQEVIEKGCMKFPEGGQDAEKKRKEFAVRLLGRLIFCWFLKKKTSDQAQPLIPESLLSVSAVKQAIQFARHKELSGYYHSILEPLFFLVLNCPIDKRDGVYKTKPWNLIPFLNGGLFTPHTDDYYETDSNGVSKYLNTLKIPDKWLEELFAVFETYNFTVDENTPVDMELSIDPEMLGRIFENLLAEINPETGETARKATGSYYTPRPIVEYMVDESLKQYLINKTQLPESTIASLLSYSQDLPDNLTEVNIQQLIDALDTIKVLDPACGSGAFPMGILQKILLILNKIDPDSKRWREKILAGVKDKLIRREIESKIDQPRYLHKLGIIRDCIYGIDIQPIAVEISKLRCFLSLIVDEKVNDKKEDRGIKPLPNLEFKFVCANTLIGLPKQDTQQTMFEDVDSIEELKHLREEYLNCTGSEKEKIEKQFKKVQSEMFKHVLFWQGTNSQTEKLSQWNPFSHESCPWFDPDWMFGVNDGFDVVIGNPPYVNVELVSREIKNIYAKLYRTFYKRYDVFGLFFELAMMKLVSKGIITFIIPSQIFNNLSYTKLRDLMLQNKWLREVLYLGDKIFKAANNDVCVLFLQKPSVSKIRLIDALDFDNPKRMEVPVDYFHTFNNVISITSGSSGDGITQKIFNQDFPKLREHFDVFQGIVTGNNEVYLLSDEQIEMNRIEKELLHPVLLGRDFEKWFVRNNNRKILYVDSDIDIKNYPNTLKYLQKYKSILTESKSAEEKSTPWYCLHRPRVKSQLDCVPKILLQRTRNPRLQTRIVATLDEIGFYGMESVIFIVQNHTCLSSYYLLCILNSSLINYLFQTKYLNVAVKAEYLKDLPIPNISKAEQKPFIELSKEILTVKRRNDNSDMTKQEKEIDQFVYKLYGLTKAEITFLEKLETGA